MTEKIVRIYDLPNRLKAVVVVDNVGNARSIRAYNKEVLADENKGEADKEDHMVTESAFFYLVLITVLMVLLNVLATRSHNRHDRHSHV